MTTKLRADLGLLDPDDTYQALIDMIDGLDPEQSRLVMAKLILLLANHIGERQVIDEAIAAARGDAEANDPRGPERPEPNVEA